MGPRLWAGGQGEPGAPAPAGHRRPSRSPEVPADVRRVQRDGSMPPIAPRATLLTSRDSALSGSLAHW